MRRPGGPIPCPQSMRLSSITALARLANNTRLVRSLGSIGESIALWLSPTNGRGALWAGFWPSSKVGAGFLCWLRSPGWTATPWLAPNANCDTTTAIGRVECADRGEDAHAPKKKSYRPEGSPRIASGRTGGRPDLGPEVDAP